MAHKTTIAGLRRKRAHVAGEIEAMAQRLVKDQQALAALDATLRLVHPDADPEQIVTIRPSLRCLNFRHGEQPRYCLEALRDTGRPLSTRQIADYVMRAKGLARDNLALGRRVREQTRRSLARMLRRGAVRQLLGEPEGWWELVE
jgi:hypothetical protein